MSASPYNCWEAIRSILDPSSLNSFLFSCFPFRLCCCSWQPVIIHTTVRHPVSYHSPTCGKIHGLTRDQELFGVVPPASVSDSTSWKLTAVFSFPIHGTIYSTTLNAFPVCILLPIQVKPPRKWSVIIQAISNYQATDQDSFRVETSPLVNLQQQQQKLTEKLIYLPCFGLVLNATISIWKSKSCKPSCTPITGPSGRYSPNSTSVPSKRQNSLFPVVRTA